MRPDLFEQHTVHFHGYPNASSYFDGVPDASVAIAISGSMTYYYTAPDAGTYFFHCHITPPEHLQMGMVGQLYVRPRQNTLAPGASLLTALTGNNMSHGLSTDGLHCSDILCTGATPAPVLGASREAANVLYAYNDGDGSTAYDVEYPMQLMGFDPAFHFVGMTFNPEDFSGMKDKYFMISGRSYPDTVSTDVIKTQASDGLARPSQPISSKIVLTSCTGSSCAGKTHRALLRVSDLNVTEFHTLATNGIPMKVVGWNARLLRDMAGNNLAYNTNSITLGGGESADVIIDSADVPPGTYFLYTTNLDHLSNDAENVGGMMTEIVVQ
jgi:FtsP/CotA-like multicopper oxidase with cupredoxin domain